MIGDENFYAFFNANTHNSSEEMEFVFNAYNQHVKEKKGPLKVIIELDEYAQLDRSAREYLEKHTTKGICEATVTKSIAQRIIVNFYFKVKSHSHPSRAFKSKEDALKWVNTF